MLFSWQKQLLIEFPAHEDAEVGKFLWSCRVELIERGTNSARVSVHIPRRKYMLQMYAEKVTDIYLPNGDCYVSGIDQTDVVV